MSCLLQASLRMWRIWGSYSHKHVAQIGVLKSASFILQVLLRRPLCAQKNRLAPVHTGDSLQGNMDKVIL